jgi:hypothetical protein
MEKGIKGRDRTLQTRMEEGIKGGSEEGIWEGIKGWNRDEKRNKRTGRDEQGW